MDCIVCGGSLKNVGGFEENQPLRGAAFQTSGHYGSAVFDPMDGTFLEINVCDSCLREAGGRGRVLMGYPRPVAPRFPMVRWPEKAAEKG